MFVNGKHMPYVDAKGETQDEFSGYAMPASFDITRAVHVGQNQISILCVRTKLNELGTGGLLGAPVTIYIYREKD